MGQPKAPKQTQNAQPPAERPKGTIGVRRLADGTLEALEIRPDTVAELRHSGVGKLGDYFDVAFGKRESRIADSERGLREFMRTINDTACFYCCDDGTVGVALKTKVGVNTLHFACGCAAGGRYASTCQSVATIEHLAPLTCRLGGDTGEFCPLVAKADRCKRFSCPKFR